MLHGSIPDSAGVLGGPGSRTLAFQDEDFGAFDFVARRHKRKDADPDQQQILRLVGDPTAPVPAPVVYVAERRPALLLKAIGDLPSSGA